jgi:hypothetical protein
VKLTLSPEAAILFDGSLRKFDIEKLIDEDSCEAQEDGRHP